MIAVVGGGIGGLAAGWELARAGADVVVLEATHRPGGVIRSERVEGRVVELGPQRARLAAPFRRLVGELGLEDELVVAPDLPLFVWHDGALREVPMDLRSALRTDLLGWGDRLRLLLEPLTPGLREDETAGQYFSRKLGRGAYDRVVAPLFGGLYGSDPEDMPARHALAGMLARTGVKRSLLRALVRAGGRRGGAPPCSFRNGLQTLTDALAADLGDRLRLSTPVREVRKVGGGGGVAETAGGAGCAVAPGFRLMLDNGEVGAEHVVLATPAGPAADLLRGMAPDVARGLEGLRYNPLALVHLISDAAVEGLGFQIPFAEGTATRGVTFNRAMFHRPGLHTAFLGGAHAPEVTERPDDEIARLAVQEFRRMMGVEARPVRVSRAWMPAWDRTWDGLLGLEWPAGISVCANWNARPGILGRLAEARNIARRLSGGAPDA